MGTEVEQTHHSLGRIVLKQIVLTLDLTKKPEPTISPTVKLSGRAIHDRHSLTGRDLDFTLGGGGGTTGYTGTIRVATGEQRCNSTSGYYIQSEYITCNVENGVIKSVVIDAQGNPKKEWTTGLQTIPLSDAR